ncbi:hypothetical protein JNUCC0626_22955 [Lentzea sp. JNUCC 0626]|uniref:hypothetical protein n=1 Tax=Lentzea sp. JNUCC 0626 TaxID=3367513 RepID=UPI00374A41BD
MTEPERSSKGSDVRIVLQATLLVLGTGLTFFAGWAMWGGGGIVAAVFASATFLFVYWAITREKAEISTGRIIWLAVCVGVTLLVFLSSLT